MSSDILARALAQSQLKYGPQGAVLRQLLSDSAATYGRTRQVNNSNARATTTAAVMAQPQVSGAFDQALQSANANASALGMSADPQVQAYDRRVGEQKANALVDLSQRQRAATEGNVFANSQARSEYMGGKGKILGQIADLARQSGLDTSVQYGNLLDAASKQALAQSGLDERVRHDQATEGIQSAAAAASATKAAAKTAAAAKPKWAPATTQAGAKDQIDGALTYVQQMQGHLPTDQIKQILLTGEILQPRRDKSGNAMVDAHGQPVLDQVSHPKFAKDYVQAALDLADPSKKALSAASVRALHNRRIKVGALGYATLAGTPAAQRTKNNLKSALLGAGQVLPQLQPPKG